MPAVFLSNRGRSAVVLYCFLGKSIMAYSITSFIAGHVVEQGEKDLQDFAPMRGINLTDKHVAGAEEASAPVQTTL